MEELEAFLAEQGLEKYYPVFVENEIDLETLAILSEEDLIELGLPMGPRRKIQRALTQGSPETIPNASMAPPLDPASVEPSLDQRLAERRQVTIVFADLCRFSQISAALGAEETHRLLNRYFETIDQIIESYGGSIDKHIGDCVMAVFGAPVAHSNDPERAIRAAQDIHQSMPTISKDFSEEVASHIGIASGQVVASDTGSNQHSAYTITGESVNLASRLSDLATAGETLVADTVRKAVTRFADFSARGDVVIKGFAEPVAVWQLGHVKETPATLRQGRLIGRRSECSQCQAVIEEVKRSGLGQSIILRGEPGIGKSRLVEEFVSFAKDNEFFTCRGEVLDFGAGRGQDAIRTLVTGLVGLERSAGESERRALFEEVLSRSVIAPEQAVFLLDLLNLSLSESENSTYQAMENAARNEGKQKVLDCLVRHRAARDPVFLLIEDLHWSDSITLDFVSALTKTAAENPVLLAITSRPEGAVMEQAWLATFAPCPLVIMELLPLRKSEAIDLAREVSSQQADVLVALVERSDGNPLFIEQLAQGGIEIAEQELPDTLQGIVLARTDRLQPPDALALKAAAVIGNRFAMPVLRHLIDDPHYNASALIEHRLIREEEGQLVFAHALIRDGVYGSLLSADRQRLHEAAAAWFRRDEPYLYAQHLHRAENDGAAEAFYQAARHFELQHQLERAIEAARLAVKLSQETEGTNFATFLLFEGRLLRDLGRLQEAQKAFHQALEKSEDKRTACRSKIGLAGVMRVTDQIDEAWRELDEAEALVATDGFDLERAQIHELRGNLCFPLGRVERCLSEHMKGYDFAQKSKDPMAQAQSLGGIGDAYYAAGKMRSAKDWFASCVAFADQHGFERIKSANLSSFASTSKFMLDLPAGIEGCRDAARTSIAIGAKRSLINALHSEIELLIERLELDLSEEKITQAIDCIDELGAPRFKARSLHYRGRVQFYRGDRDAAHASFSEALEISLATGSGYVGPTISSSIACASRDAEDRARHLQLGLELLDKGAVAHNLAEYHRDAIEIALEEGRWNDVPALALAMRRFSDEPLPWIDFWAARGEKLALWGISPGDQDLAKELRELRKQAQDAGLLTALPAFDQALGAV